MLRNLSNAGFIARISATNRLTKKLRYHCTMKSSDSQLHILGWVHEQVVSELRKRPFADILRSRQQAEEKERSQMNNITKIVEMMVESGPNILSVMGSRIPLSP